MSEVAFNRLIGQKIYANDFNETEWEKLRAASEQGHITMECCGARAVLKTSPGFLKFFAHYSDECATAPETKWHFEVKSLILKELTLQGISCFDEKTGKSKNGKKWKADTYFEFNGRKVVIEVQHSYQHLKKYHERQQIYNDSDIECYWLLYRERFSTLTSSIANFRLRHEFNNQLPSSFFAGNTPELPMMWADIEAGLKIRGVAFIEYSLPLWIQSILNKKFKYENYKWLIEGEPIPTPVRKSK